MVGSMQTTDPDTGTVSDHLFDAVVRSPFPLKRFRLTQDARRPEVPVSGLIRRSAVEATGLAERPGLSPRALALALALVGPFHEVPEVLLRRPPAVPAAVDEVGSSPEELFAVMFSAPLPPLQRARLVAQTVTYPMRPGRHR